MATARRQTRADPTDGQERKERSARQTRRRGQDNRQDRKGDNQGVGRRYLLNKSIPAHGVCASPLPEGCDPNRATQCRAHSVAADSRNFRDVAGMSRYTPPEDRVAPVFPPRCRSLLAAFKQLSRDCEVTEESSRTVQGIEGLRTDGHD